ncbi:cytochrome P450 2U1-like isoform X2 [Lineus longissimus]|uniref:cytochrome P450 2U1-like isoform X2 n=1 Tax=Lineus longissimus TaxID=88925 RepID=UPI002B4DE17F
MFVSDYPTEALICALTALLVTVVLKWWRRDPRLPPGPRGVPLLGYLPFIGSNIGETARQLGRKYNSAVISVPIGQKILIFLNSAKAVSEAFESNRFQDRPAYAVKTIHKGRGILSSDGKLWKEQRHLSFNILRDLGVGKLRSEIKIQEEIRELISELLARQGKPCNVQYLLRTAVTNVISCLLFDQRYNYDDEEFVNYFKVFSDSLIHLRRLMLLDIFPFLKFIPGDAFCFQRLLSNDATLAAFFESHVANHLTSLDSENPRDFIDAYIAQLPGNELSAENRLQLVNVIGDLFKAGGETVSGTLRWALLYMATHPDIQQKVQDDLDRVYKMADNESKMADLPTLSDKKHAIYTHAVLLEVQRFSTVSGNGMPHCNLGTDIEFQGYRIPAGTAVFGNQWAVFRDPTLWQYPDVFDPRNFLTEDGDLRNQDRLMNFGVGELTNVHVRYRRSPPIQ